MRWCFVLGAGLLLCGCPLTVTDDYAIGAGGAANGSGGSTTTTGGTGGQGACAAGTADCDGDADNGCETETNTLAHCGACAPCVAPTVAEPHGTQSCVDGACSFTCEAGYADCNGESEDGCEASLRDSATCGVCTRNCQGGACTGNPPACGPVTIAAADDPHRMVLAGPHLYWTDGSQRILRVELTGGTPQELAKTGTDSKGIAVDATHVYWVDDWWEVRKVPRDGGATQVLATALASPHDLVVDASFVYFTTAYDGGGVQRVPIDGGTVEWLTAGLSTPTTLGLHEGVLYVTDTWNDDVVTVPVAGGTHEIFDSASVDAVHAIFLSSESVFWTTRGTNDGQVIRVDFDGTDRTILAENQWRARGVAADATHVYWTTLGSKNPGEGTVKRAPLSGGPELVLATNEWVPRCIVVGDDAVYYSTMEAIKKIVK